MRLVGRRLDMCRTTNLAGADSQLAPHFRAASGLRRVRREEIGDNLNFVPQLKNLLCLSTQAFRNGGDRVGMDESVLNAARYWGFGPSSVVSVPCKVVTILGADLPIISVARKAAVAWARRNEREKRPTLLPDLSHFNGERERVVGARKNGVLPDGDLVEMNPAPKDRGGPAWRG